jgi:AraC-like DNA-binding protein
MLATGPNNSVHIGLVQFLIRYMSDAGFDSADVFRIAGVSPDILESMEERVPSRPFRAIWESALQLAEDQDFGLHIGIEMANSTIRGNFLFYIMMNCPTTKRAMERFIRYHKIMENASRHQLTIKRNLAYFTWKYVNPGFKTPRHNYEAQLCSSALVFRRITENNLDLKEVRFKHPRPDDISEHERIFNAPVLFEQPQNELVIGQECLEAPIVQASSELLDTLEQFAEKLLSRLKLSQTYSEKVTQEINKSLVRGDRTGIESVAKALGMGVRSLQIKLKNEGKTYQEIFDELRKEIAREYLQKPDITICDVTFLLGFSEQSAFNHAFKRWTGYTPMEFRNTASIRL